MTTLNLLPPDKKQELGLVRHYLVIKNLVYFILLVTLLIALILLFAKIILQNNFTRVVEETTLTTKYAKLFNKDIRKFNQDLEAVFAAQKNFMPWTKFIINLGDLAPADVVFTTLNINRDKILITGVAKNRTNLLELKKNLENSPMLSDVTIPLENLLQKENADFSIKANINLANLSGYEY